jgi:hypothetical protein
MKQAVGWRWFLAPIREKAAHHPSFLSWMSNCAPRGYSNVSWSCQLYFFTSFQTLLPPRFCIIINITLSYSLYDQITPRSLIEIGQEEEGGGGGSILIKPNSLLLSIHLHHREAVVFFWAKETFPTRCYSF